MALEYDAPVLIAFIY